MVAACALVATRQWPEFRGLMSMNVSVRSSSWILNEGICPSRILQKTQSMHPSPGGGLDLDRPPVRIGVLAVLDAHNGVVQPLGQGRDAPPVDRHLLAPVGELAHRRDHRGRAGAEHFLEAAGFVGLHHLVDGDLALRRLHTPCLLYTSPS